MKMKKTLLYGLSFVLVAAVAIGGTLAYLTSEDSDVNVMTLGNVKIEQHEYQRVVNADGTYATETIDNQTSYVLEKFVQVKPLLPIVGDPSQPGGSAAYAGYDAIPVRMSQVGSYGGMDVFAGKNAQDKFVTLENTGKTDAYVRTLVAIEIGNGNASLIGTSYHKTWTKNSVGTIVIDGNNYALTEYVYAGANGVRHENGILPAGDTSYPNLSQVYIKHSATNEDCEALDGNGNGTLDILVLSQAVQADGFADAQTALDTAFGDITSTNHPWTAGVKIPAVVEDADGLVEALESGKDVVFNDDVKIDPAGMSNAYGTTGINVKNGQTIDGNGNTLDIKGAGGTWDSGINTTGGLIKNLTVTGSFRGIFINHNSSYSETVVLENVIINGTTYTISCDQGMNQNFKAYNSTFNGWTSYAATLGNAKFENCKFGEGNGYAYCRPYAPTTFVGCEFEAGYAIDPCAPITFVDCTLDGVAITPDNVATLCQPYYGNLANVTVK